MLTVRPSRHLSPGPYPRLVAAGFRQQSAYRLAALAGLVANTTFGFLKVALLLATAVAAAFEQSVLSLLPVYGAAYGILPHGMSALLTTTMPNMGRTIATFEDMGLRDEVRIMVGGAPVTQDFADEMGADAYGDNAVEAVDKAKELIKLLAELKSS